MINLTADQIKEIADNLDSGMRCYFNTKTREIKSVINTESWLDADMEPWEEEIEEIEENWDDYIEFENLETHESFEIMEKFAESINDARLQEKLFHALNKSKPFRNFKWVIDNSGEYRQMWFDFKKAWYIRVVKDQILRLNNFEDNV
jgi:MarR-like DNA-binding transcriptional regulator SgrR of sgrS sRNA